MTHKDQVFVIDVVVTNLTCEIVVSNVINRPTCAVMKLSTIATICKYRGLMKGISLF
jgi:hypothetical protein